MSPSGQILKQKQTINTGKTGLTCTIDQFLGGGGQGEVYKVYVAEKAMALKWYFEKMATPEQRAALENLIHVGPPSDRFLWPEWLMTDPDISGFGYLMPLREPQYKGIEDLMKRRVEPSFQGLITACLELSHHFLLLHSCGLCYYDISWGNVFFDPDTGHVLICDNDNVQVNGVDPIGVYGTPGFMAPELVRLEAKPSTQTDLHSLAVLLFYILMISHPLNGKKEASIHCFDLPAMKRLYGSEPVFVFDPNNDSNRPVPGIHDNAITFWNIYPQFIKDLFTKAFTVGLVDIGARVRESEWRSTFATLRDWVFYCSCGAENFYDPEVLQKTKGKPGSCWRCHKDLRLPYRIRIDRNIIMLNRNSKLYLHHIDPQRQYNFTAPIAEVSINPADPRIWGLQNLSNENWTRTAKDGSIKEIEPGKSVALSVGMKINFGKLEGEITL